MSVYTVVRLDEALRANGLAITGVSIADANNKATWSVQPSTLQAAAQAVITAFDASPAADVAWVNLAARTAAQQAVGTDKSAVYKVARAEAAVLVDEINALRQWIVNFKAAVAAASSLSNLQTRVAALPDMPDRTLAQAQTAITAKIAAGTVD